MLMKNRRMTIGIWITVLTVVISFGLTVSLIDPQETYATEKKKITGTSKVIGRLARTKIPVPKSPIKGYLNVYHSTMSSSDPDWNNARFFFIQYNKSPDNLKGYCVITHPNGDQTFIEFEEKYTQTEGAGAWNGETDGFFLKGTGKFENIRARYKSKFTWNPSGGERSDEWVVEYF